jgi:hypothetical protein
MAAGNESTLGQGGNKGINHITMAVNNDSGRWTTTQQPTIVGRGKEGQRLVMKPPEGRG